MSAYLESVALLSDDDLRAEVRKDLVQLHTLRGRERTNAYGRLLELREYLEACGKADLYREAVTCAKCLALLADAPDAVERLRAAGQREGNMA